MHSMLGETHIKLLSYDTTFFLHFFSFHYFYNETFIHSDYSIKPLQPSSAIYGVSPFTEHHHLGLVLSALTIQCAINEPRWIWNTVKDVKKWINWCCTR